MIASALKSLGPCPFWYRISNGAALPTPGLRLVEADTAHGGDPAGGADVPLERGVSRKRIEIALEQFSARRMTCRIRRIPARRREQPRRRLVDVVFPGREQLDVAPLAQGVADWSPASSTIGSRPRSSTWAAAARPTGPAPMIATVLASLITSSDKTRNIEIKVEKRGALCRGLGIRGFGTFSAAFGDEKTHQLPHQVDSSRGRSAWSLHGPGTPGRPSGAP